VQNVGYQIEVVKPVSLGLEKIGLFTIK